MCCGSRVASATPPITHSEISSKISSEPLPLLRRRHTIAIATVAAPLPATAALPPFTAKYNEHYTHTTMVCRLAPRPRYIGMFLLLVTRRSMGGHWVLYIVMSDSGCACVGCLPQFIAQRSCSPVRVHVWRTMSPFPAPDPNSRLNLKQSILNMKYCNSTKTIILNRLFLQLLSKYLKTILNRKYEII